MGKEDESAERLSEEPKRLTDSLTQLITPRLDLAGYGSFRLIRNKETKLAEAIDFNRDNWGTRVRGPALRRLATDINYLMTVDLFLLLESRIGQPVTVLPTRDFTAFVDALTAQTRILTFVHRRDLSMSISAVIENDDSSQWRSEADKLLAEYADKLGEPIIENNGLPNLLKIRD